MDAEGADDALARQRRDPPAGNKFENGARVGFRRDGDLAQNVSGKLRLCGVHARIVRCAVDRFRRCGQIGGCVRSRCFICEDTAPRNLSQSHGDIAFSSMEQSPTASDLHCTAHRRALAAILARGLRRLLEKPVSATCFESDRERVSVSLGLSARGQGEKSHG